MSTNKVEQAEVAEAEQAEVAENALRTVTLEDGRTTTFSEKRKFKSRMKVEDGQASVTLDFDNGVTRTFVVSEALLLQFAAAGASAKLGQIASVYSDVADAVKAVDAQIAKFNNGEFIATRSPSDGLRLVNVVIVALMEASGKTKDEIEAFINAQMEKTGLSKITLFKSFRNPASKVGQIIERIESEKKKKAPVVDAVAMLGELLGA